MYSSVKTFVSKYIIILHNFVKKKALEYEYLCTHFDVKFKLLVIFNDYITDYDTIFLRELQ